MRKCENHMVIGNWQQLLQPVIHPFDLLGKLALGTVTVATRVVGVFNIAAYIVGAPLDMPAQCAGTAISDGPHDGSLQFRGVVFGVISLPIAVKDVGQFEPGLFINAPGYCPGSFDVAA